MPHEQMSDEQVAAYLRMDLREVTKLACRGLIPCRKVRGRFVFSKSDVDQWVAARVHRLDKQRLAEIEQGVSAHHGFDHELLVVKPLIPNGGLAVPLPAKTRDAAIRALVDLADRAGLVYGPKELRRALLARENLCSTALFPGVAMPHPRDPMPYDIKASFVVAGLTRSGIPFGAEDGSLTRMFFCICCKDELTHLHVLARLARLLQQPQAVEQLLSSQSAEDLDDHLLRLERAALDT